VLFDDQMNYVSGSSVQVPLITAGMSKQVMQANLPSTISKNGYLYIYVSNESQDTVFFDNLDIQYRRGPITEEEHYYPFGLTMQGISDRALQFGKVNKYRYNGIEQDTTFGVDEYEAPLRNLDPQLGRWWQVDPQSTDHADDMERWSPYVSNKDNPILNKDPRGDCPSCLLGAAIGAGVDIGYQIAGSMLNGDDFSTAVSNINGKQVLLAAAVGFATSGVSAIYEDAAVSGTTMALSENGAKAVVAGIGSLTSQTNEAVDKNEPLNISPAVTAIAALMGPVSEEIASGAMARLGVNSEVAKSTAGAVVAESNDAVAKGVTSKSEGSTNAFSIKMPDQSHVSDATAVGSTVVPVTISKISTTPTNYVQTNPAPQNNSTPYIYNQ
jgi:RHS repeat-associated protein